MPKLDAHRSHARGMLAPIAMFVAMFIAWPALAGESDPCPDGESPLPRVPLVEDVLATIDWWGATDAQVERAACRAGVPTEQQMRDWLTANPGADSSRATRTIHGVRLENQPVALLDLFERLTTTRKRDGSDQRTFTVPEGCGDFSCALQSVFPGNTGVRIAYLAARYGFNASEHAGMIYSGSANYDPLDEEELDDIIAGVADMPEQLVPVTWNHPIQHLNRGYTLTMYGDKPVLANATITVFDIWSISSRERRQYTVLHEIGHQIGDKLDIDSSERWLRLSGWTRDPSKAGTDDEWTAANESTLVSHYAATNPDEDFAESVSAYRYNPELLLQASPEKYALIRDVVYDGVEFTSEESCTGAAPRSRELKRSLTVRAREAFRGRPWSEILRETGALRACRDELFDHATGPATGSTAAIEHCVSSALRAHMLDRRELDPDYVRMLERSGALEGGVDVFSGAGAAIAGLVRADIQEGIRRVVVEEVLRPGSLAMRVGIQQNETPAEYCADNTRHIYQRASYLRGRYDDASSRLAGFLFARREQLAEWASAICLRSMGSARRVFAPSDQSVRAAAAEVFGTASRSTAGQ